MFLQLRVEIPNPSLESIEMPQKRKKRVLTPVDENEETMDPSEDNVHGNSKHQHGPMYTIMSNAQLNETFHNKYIREMQQLYMKVCNALGIVLVFVILHL